MHEHRSKRRWYVSLEEHPTLTVARFGTMSLATGHQLWDEIAWPLPVSELTEAAILSEFYDAVLAFWETRA